MKHWLDSVIYLDTVNMMKKIITTVEQPFYEVVEQYTSPCRHLAFYQSSSCNLWLDFIKFFKFTQIVWLTDSQQAESTHTVLQMQHVI